MTSKPPKILVKRGDDFPHIRGAWLDAKYVNEPPLVYDLRTAPTLSEAMQLPEVRALVEAAKWAKSLLVGLPMDEATAAQMDALTTALVAFKDPRT